MTAASSGVSNNANPLCLLLEEKSLEMQENTIGLPAVARVCKDHGPCQH